MKNSNLDSLHLIIKLFIIELLNFKTLLLFNGIHLTNIAPYESNDFKMDL